MLDFTKCLGVLAILICSRGSSDGQERGRQVGDVAPEFTCQAEAGQIWESRDHVGKGIIVIYFYPSDFSFNCTRQAQRYRDFQRELAKAGVEVVGVSCDTPESHHLFREAHGLNFPLLADVDGCVARQFGVPLRVGGKAMPRTAQGAPLLDFKGKPVQLPRRFTAARWTFVISAAGRILYREPASASKDSQQVLQFVQQLPPE